MQLLKKILLSLTIFLSPSTPCLLDCPSCPPDSYNPDYKSPNFNISSCQKRSESLSPSRRILIIPPNYQNFTENALFTAVYASLPLAFSQETQELSKYKNPTFLTINFLDYPYEFQTNSSFPVYFRALTTEIVFQPLFCEETSVLGCFFRDRHVEVVIRLLNYELFLFVSRKMGIFNIVFDAGEAWKGDVFYSDLQQNAQMKMSAFFTLETFDLEGENAVLQVFNGSFRGFSANGQGFLHFLIQNSFSGGSFLMENVIIENFWLKSGIFNYFNQIKRNSSFILIRNLTFRDCYFTMGIYSLFQISEFEGDFIVENLGFSNLTNAFYGENAYLFDLKNCRNAGLKLTNLTIYEISNFGLFKFSNCDVFIENITTFSSNFSKNTILIENTNTKTLFYSFQISSCSLQNETDYFLLNFGDFSMKFFLFSDFENLQFYSSNQNSQISLINGTIKNATSYRIFTIAASQNRFESIHFSSISTKTNIFLLDSTKNTSLKALYFKEISSKTAFFQTQNVDTFSLQSILCFDLKISYFMARSSSLTSIQLFAVSFTNLTCYRLFVVLTEVRITFQHVFIKKAPLISGPYLLQFYLKNAFFIGDFLVFEDFYGLKRSPFSMFILGMGSFSFRNSSFINLGWINNDISTMFAVDDNAVFFFFFAVKAFFDSCVVVSIDLSVYSGLVLFMGESSNFFTIHNSFFRATNIPNLHSTGIIAVRADYLNFTKNLFQGFLCPNTANFRFYPIMYMNGAVAVLGDTLYSKSSNNRVAVLSGNSFRNCSCVNGGSLSVINYNRIFVWDCAFYESFATVRGGIMEFISVGKVWIKGVIGNHSKGEIGGIAYFRNAEEVLIENGYFGNVFGGKSSGVELKNTQKITILNVLAENLLCEGKGAFLNQNSFSAYVEGLRIVNARAVEGGFYIFDNADFAIYNSVICYTYAVANGGFLSVDYGRNIVISNVSAFNVSSEGNGGVFLLKSVQFLVISDFLIKKCYSNSYGILYLKPTNISAVMSVNRLFCLNNFVKEEGSCLFYDSSSMIFLNNTQVLGCFGTPFVFTSAFQVKAFMESVDITECRFLGYLLKIENVIFHVRKVNLEDNSSWKKGEIVILVSLISNFDSFFSDFSVKITNYNNFNTIFFHLVNANVNFDKITLLITQIFNLNFSLIEASEASRITINNSVFSSLQPDTHFQSLIYVENGEITINSCSFLENQTPLLKVIESNLTIFEVFFLMNRRKILNEIPNEIYFDSSIDSGSFLKISNTKIEGNAGKVIFAHSPKILIISSNFTNNNNNSDFSTTPEYAAFLLENILSLTVIKGNFTGFASNSNGAVFKIINSCLIKLELTITNCVFHKNAAFLGGAIYISSDSSIFITSSSFSQNHAKSHTNFLSGIGGALYFQACNPINSLINLTNNEFSHNLADLLLPDIFSSVCSSLINNSFLYNNETTSKDQPLRYMSLPFEVLQTKKPVTSIKSGNEFDIDFQIVDCHKQILQFDFESIGNLNSQPVNTGQNLLIKSLVTKSNAGLFSFKNIKIFINPGSSVYLTVTITVKNKLITQAEKLQSTSLHHTENCSEGEITATDKSCFRCPNGTYSSNDFPSETHNMCLKCPENAECWNGSFIVPKPGYWKSSRNSTLILECMIPEACVNDIMSNSETKCAEFHQGNMCNMCVLLYGRFNQDEFCKMCGDLLANQLTRAFLILLFAILYIIMSAKTILNSSEESTLDSIFKIIINHFQRMAVLTLSELQSAVKSFLSFFAFLNIFTVDIFSNDCFVQYFTPNIFNYYFYKFVASLFLPGIIALLCLPVLTIFNILLYLRKRESLYLKFHFLRKFLLYLLISAFLSYSFLINTSISFLTCGPISNDPAFEGQEYLAVDPNLRCWQEEHFIGVMLAVGIGLVGWGVAYPMILWLNMRKSLEKKIQAGMKQSKHITGEYDEKTFYFFFKDYKREFYFWECIVFIQKLLLNLFSQGNRWSIGNYMMLINILFLLVYVFFVTKYKPFNFRFINTLELLSLVCCISTNISMLGLSSKTIGEVLKYMFYVIISVVNFIFFGYSLYISIKYIKWKEVFSKKKKNVDDIARQILMKVSKVMSVPKRMISMKNNRGSSASNKSKLSGIPVSPLNNSRASSISPQKDFYGIIRNSQIN